MRLVLCVVASMALVGCATGGVRHVAASTLTCQERDLTLTPRANGVWVADGCGRTAVCTRPIAEASRVECYRAGTLDREAIRQVIAGHHGEIRYCYERELRKSPELAGTVAVKFIIAPSGEVRSSEVAHSSARNPGLEECLVGRLGTWTFPEPQGGGAVVATYPFMFKQAEGAGEASCDNSSSQTSGTRCGSLDKQLIRQVVMENLGEIRNCYEREVKTSPRLAGTVAVRLTIAPTGMVALSEVARSTVDNAALELCVAARIRSWTFPKPSGDGPVTVTYPFNFDPGAERSPQEENWTPHARPVSVVLDPEPNTHGFGRTPSH